MCGNQGATYRCDVGQKTINVLSEDVLLEMFTFYVYEDSDLDGWQKLVHVCRKWRSVVFASPHPLNLQLLCTNKRPVEKMLDIWPALPIVLSGGYDKVDGIENIIAALEHNDRMHKNIFEDISDQLLGGIGAMPPQPFPVLTFLRLESSYESLLILPESFLGGFVPHLQYLLFVGIAFPALPKLLLSAHDLVTLRLWDIPHSGYISPKTMITCLSVMSGVTTLHLRFRSPRSCPNRARRRPPPLTRVVLPALAALSFKGVSDYLEDLVSQIDAPLHHKVDIVFFNQLIFDIPQLYQFIDRLGKFEMPTQADIVFFEDSVLITLPDSESAWTGKRTRLAMEIPCGEPDWQMSSLAQICGPSFPLVYTLERLNILEKRGWPQYWPDDMENTQLLELLQPFTAVRELRLPGTIAQRVALALNEHPLEDVTIMMPALRSIFIGGPSGKLSRSVEEAMSQFLAAQQLSDLPVAVHHQEREWVATVSGSP